MDEQARKDISLLFRQLTNEEFEELKRRRLNDREFKRLRLQETSQNNDGDQNG